tara:strand:- start:542 stop:880 length:339 start_codon:yes stop_codon:yes gene_type:complete
MCKATFKRRDKNRFRKVYPYLRKAPVYEYASDKEAEIEAGEIIFTDASSGTYNFTTAFKTIPQITAITYDSEGNNSANVNVYVYSLTTTSVKFKTSSAFTGKVQFHAIRIAC